MVSKEKLTEGFVPPVRTFISSMIGGALTFMICLILATEFEVGPFATTHNSSPAFAAGWASNTLRANPDLTVDALAKQIQKDDLPKDKTGALVIASALKGAQIRGVNLDQLGWDIFEHFDSIFSLATAEDIAVYIGHYPR